MSVSLWVGLFSAIFAAHLTIERIELAAITSEVIKGTFAENRPFEDLAKRPRNVNRM
jgi:hypothetical protein